MIFITGKKGTKAKLTISRKAEIPLYKKRKLDAILINYGSPNLDRCINGNNKLVILNRHVSKTKYAVIIPTAIIAPAISGTMSESYHLFAIFNLHFN